MGMFRLYANYLRISVITILFFTSNSFTTAQSHPDYNMTLTNGTKLNDNTIEFDVTIKAVSEPIALTSYQCSFEFNCDIANGGELSFVYVEGSSQLTNLPTFGIGINTCDGDPKLTFASMAGSDIILPAEVVVGRFRLTNSLAFANIDPNLKWNFEGFVSTILTGSNFQDITTPGFHTTNLTLDSDNKTVEVPEDYQLLQNYPNPFNPSTKIKFTVKEQSSIKLVVYNLLGEVVEELLDNQVAAGNHEFVFNSKDLSSGTYVYTLEANDKFVGSRKMMLLK